MPSSTRGVPRPRAHVQTWLRRSCLIHTRYDAWNHLVAVRADDEGESGDLILSYSDDALARRITRTPADTENDPATVSYYSAQWQVLQDNTSTGPLNQYVWSPFYVDDLILRDRSAVTEVAQTMVKKNINIDFVGLIDIVGVNNNELPTNVKEGLNIYVKGGSYLGLLGGNKISGAVNEPLKNTSHETIDDDARTQAMIIEAMTKDTVNGTPMTPNPRWKDVTL
jgi:hypothetical protein